MKSQFIEELKSGHVVKDIFILSRKVIKEKKDGGAYAVLEFSDRSGSIEGIAWDKIAENFGAINVGDLAFVTGNVNEYNDRLQIVVSSIERVGEADANPEDFLPRAEEDIERAYSEIQDYCHRISDSNFRKLLDAVFADREFVASFKLAPAAKRVHHAYLGGLVVHTRNVLRLAEAVSKVYENLNVDLLMTAAVLHDVGKVFEYDFSRKIDFSTPGRMLGHIVIGYEIVGAKIKNIPDFPESMRLRLLHMILSHHGEFEWGSPKQPLFVEALVLHFIDNLDSKVEMMLDIQKRNRGKEKQWSDYHPYLEREIYLQSDE